MSYSLVIDFQKYFQIYKDVRGRVCSNRIPEPFLFDKSVSNSANLSNLALSLLTNEAIEPYICSLRPLMVELASRLVTNDEIEKTYLKLAQKPVNVAGSVSLSSLTKIGTSCPEILTIIEYYLQKKQFWTMIHPETIDQHEMHWILLSFYRLVRTNCEKFSRYIDSALLYTIISSDRTTGVNKYLAIRILAVCLFLSEKVALEMVSRIPKDQLFGVYEYTDSVDYQFLDLYEAKRLETIQNSIHLSPAASENKYTIKFQQTDFSLGATIVADVVIPNISSLVQGVKASPSGTDFVPIQKSTVALNKLAQSIQKSEPVLLVGRSGTGKTFLINEVAKQLQLDTMVKIHLNQQTDSKLLLGTYSSGATPGTFEWKNGVLTTAVKEGRWVLVEDIDKAPNEVLSILLSLLEKRELTIPSRGEVIKAANGFQLISSLRLAGDSRNHTLPQMIGQRLWNVVELEELETKELKLILSTKFPLLVNFTSMFIKCFQNVKELYDSRKFLTMNRGAQPRALTIRDLMKLCKRCNKILTDNNVASSHDMLTEEVFDLIFQETVDCFTSSIVERAPIEAVVKEIGVCLEVPTSRATVYLSKHIPSFQEFEDSVSVGRAHLTKKAVAGLKPVRKQTSFAKTNHCLRLMEKIGVGISLCEPLLMVGETGTGKTTIVQEVARLLNKKLTVINVSQQTEVGDLLGGFKPVTTKSLAIPLEEDFEELFKRSFSVKKNEQFMKLLAKMFNKSQWKGVIRLWREAFKMAENLFAKQDDDSTKKRKLNDTDKAELMAEWRRLYARIQEFEKQGSSAEKSLVFKFVEGSLVHAVRNGDWVLLDEMNLAAPETLDSVSELLNEEGAQRNLLLSEKGDVESIKAHPDFRIFGCMNPATDVGKKDLPEGIRSRFTEIYVHSPDQDIADLLMIIDSYIGRYSLSDEWVGNDVAELYLSAKRLADANELADGSNQKPHFSVRTLTRTLQYVRDILPIYGLRRSLYEGFCMSFLTLLDASSETKLRPLIEKYTIQRLKNAKSVISQIPSNPSSEAQQYVQFRHYWMRSGPLEPEEQPHYIMTPFVEKNLMNLVRASSGRFPVLIQGPTSSGKTSMINYLAKITGHTFVRINNHEHTDLQEYLGTYVSDDTGKLVFREGVLVDALRKGHWIVLDELNLAPTDVLEALNRLLDDNRELFIPETQEVVTPHPDFMLFATQNPPGLYGGRKILSKAFRNRFLELHFDDIPQDELEIILRERCQIAPSYAQKIVEVYKELTVQRQSTRLFEKKDSFATLRDLFRWALREAVGYEQLAANGYMLLAERVRRPEEKVVVKQALEKVMRVKLDIDTYYQQLEIPELLQLPSSIVWTKAMRRLAVLVATSIKYKEPLLLVGETGCGKTTVCQLIAQFYGKQLVTVNAHQNTETGDLLGSQRPVRNRQKLKDNLEAGLKQVLTNHNVPVSTVTAMMEEYESLKKQGVLEESEKQLVEQLISASKVLFEWFDGPLVCSMKDGSFFLLDEISLADDSVLERLNSVLEPERSLLLAEKGSEDAAVTAADSFQFFATMNPGGDYGKKELSPALRNRFTEIWVPSMEDFDDVRQIVESQLNQKAHGLIDSVVQFSQWYGHKLGDGSASSGVISLRDILAWVSFINNAVENGIRPHMALLHGACMVFIDALGTNNTAFLADNEERLRQFKLEFVDKLAEISKTDLRTPYLATYQVQVSDTYLQCGDFKIDRVHPDNKTSFNLDAPTTALNAMRVIRALQVHKPILLEGSPGVGKTSLVSALAAAVGKDLTRINLSEQTDLIDLFGSDSPVEEGETGEFRWRDAPFLRAMKRGEWVLLDEMNLASQSVLEGLNACLDHRGEAYIPELDRSFRGHPDFLVFAAQNPQHQGGGRKGLPKSFVNRFTVVYVDMLTETDLKMIANHLYPALEKDVSDKLIDFVSELEKEVVIHRQWGATGGPWEFNLRDTLRWLSLLNSPSLLDSPCAGDFFEMIVQQRFRTPNDRLRAQQLYEQIFGARKPSAPYYQLNVDYVQCQAEVVPRNFLIQHIVDDKLSSLQCNYSVLETLLRCVKKQWPLILVGPSNSGKTELIRFASGILGTKLYEFSMNSDIDSMDILGGYEQDDLSREISEFAKDLKELLMELAAYNLLTNSGDSSVLKHTLRFIDFLSNAEFSKQQFGQLESFFDVLQQSMSNDKFDQLKEQYSVLAHKLNQGDKIKFRWFDSLLVQAVEKGYWLVLDNANLCSPSVLDRLNSLLEMDGSLIINECTDADGNPRHLKPHPNFRLFLTADPAYGELSRAMRNRGIEIFMNPIESRASDFDRLVLQKNSTSSFVGSFNSSFAPLAVLLDALKAPNGQTPDILSNVLPIRSGHVIKDLVPNVYKVSGFESVVSPLEAIAGRIEFYESLGLPRKLEQAYNRAQKGAEVAVLAKSQALQPLINTYILGKLSEEYAPTEEAHYLFHVLGMVYEAQRYLTKLEKRVESAKVTELTYLEKSAAHASGRALKSVPKLNLYGLVTKIVDFVKNEVSSMDELWQISGKYKSLFKLMFIWQNIIECSKVQHETKLRIYQDKILDWLDDYSGEGSGLRQVVDSFSKQLQLTQGYSMTLIWEKSKDLYPSTPEGWSNYHQLMDVAVEFDEICMEQYSENFEMVTSLRQVFVALFEDCVNGGLIEHLEELKQKITALRDISGTFLNQRKHPYTHIFDLVLNFADLLSCSLGAGLEKSRENYRFALLAARSTSSLTKWSQDRFKPYPRIFDQLWTSKGEPKVVDLLNQTLVEDLVAAGSGMKQLSGSSIDEALVDARFMLQMAIKNSAAFSSPLENIQSLLVQWILYICGFHTGESLEFLNLQQNITSETVSSYQKSLDQLPNFQQVFSVFFVPALLSTPSRKSVGSSWVLFACGMIMLFVPNHAYDPAIVDHVAYDDYAKLESLIGEIKDAWVSFRRVQFGDQETYAESVLPQVEETAPSAPKVFRSGEPIDTLFEEWTIFLDSTMKAKTEGLIGVAETIMAKSSLEVENLHRNSTQLFLRLKQNFAEFSDLNDVLGGFIYSLRLGLDLLDENRTCESKLWSVDPSVLGNADKTKEIYSGLEKTIKKQSIDHEDVEKLAIFNMKVLKFQKAYADTEEMFQKSLMTVYYRWTARRLKQDEQESLQQGVFQFSDPTLDAEKEFQQLFPDADIELTGDGSNINWDHIYSQIASSYCNYFLGEAQSLETVVLDGTDVLDSVDKLVKHPSGAQNTESLLSSTIYQIVTSMNKFSSNQGQTIDFYRDYSPYETRRSGKIVLALQGHVNELLKQWPEHATLQQLFRICQEYVDFRVDTPVYRLLAKIEQIYTFVSEWEKYAHSGVSLQRHGQSLADLIVSWRRLELNSWKEVLANEEKAVEQAVGKWWFHLFESIVVSEEQDVLKLVAAVNVFISRGTKGDLKHRFRLVRAFSEQVKHDKTIYSALMNILDFFQPFLTIVEQAVSNEKKTLEKQVKEVILLASWKDVNIDALKQSSRKSHQSLYKLVRKYRDLLNSTITEMVESGLGSTPVVINQKTIGMVPVSLGELGSSEVSLFNNIKTIHHNMQVYLGDLSSESFGGFYEYCEEIVAAARKLREETPKTLTDENKKLVASLKQEKRKLLSDTLKELRRSGIKLQTTTKTQALLASTTTILANSNTLRNGPLEGADVYFFRVLELLPRLRAAVSNCHAEVPITDIQRALAAVENVLVSLITTRHKIADVSVLHVTVENVLKSFKVANSGKPVAIDPQTHEIVHVVQKLPEIVSFSGKVTEIISELGISATLKLETPRLDIDTKLFTETEQSMVADARNGLDKMKTQLYRWKADNPTVKFVAETVLDWLDVPVSINTLSLSKSDDDVEEVGSKLFGSILVSIQKLRQLQTTPLEADEDNWLVDSQRRLVKYIDLLYGEVMQERIVGFLNLLENIQYDEETSAEVKSVLGYVVPLLEHYLNAVSIIVSKIQDNYVGTSKGLYELCTLLLTVATDGFCSPEGSQEEESGQDQNGTGLGDGEGATNNSKDVEEDENLEDYVGGEQDGEKEQREDENDDAVDVEGDMKGDLEEMEGKDEEGEDGDEEEADEEVGDVDDLDPNAVDEKMWDEEATSEKEKEKDDLKGKQGEDMEAVDEDEKEGDGDQGEQEKTEEGDEGEEEDVAEQEDEVRNDGEDGMEMDAEQGEALELEDDINLDGDEEGDEEEEEEGDMDIDMEEESEMKDEQEDAGEDAEADQENVDGQEASEEEAEDGEENNDAEPGQDDGLDEEMEAGEEQVNDEGENENPSESEELAGENAKENEEQEDMDGAEGGAENAPDTMMNADSAASANEGAQAEGASAAADNEQDSVGASGAAQAQEAAEQTDSSRENASNTLKQMGDALKEFYKRHQDILETDVEAAEQKGENPDEFQHLDGDNADTDTQAVGAASEDQAMKLDDDMEIDEAEIPQEHNQDESVKQEGAADGGEAGELEETDEPADEKELGGRVKREHDGIPQLDDLDSDEEMDSDAQSQPETATALSSLRSWDEARDLWQHADEATREFTAGLCEQLRLILEPTVATKLRGDYKTGKRLNMKKIIPYIASQFRKDKIWMRRTKPNKRQYQIMISVDDSKSMAESKAVEIAFQSIALVSKALTQLESGQLSVVKFGETTNVVHPFESQFSAEAGAKVFRNFTFEQTRTDVRKLVETSLDLFAATKPASENLWQLEIVLSDGVCEDHDTIRRLVRRARENHIMLVFVVIDGIANTESILQMSQAKYVPDASGELKLQVDKYLDTFPFEYYVVVSEIEELPEMLASILRQFFAETGDR
ncbi:hypothetical protein OGAPHI_005733 [Ogataea philodendri]|uniref:Midasin n=4 Tax=Saccharomycotina TaxID=147537 RepID=A0A9P8T295_9ASCO|nr:uncharacterized protein OGAPHI_005733 [Ogataea philodendri]KAH3662481.1 hypothetical protein OGAPHI_005733 [Ogataea philodendri]